MRILVLAERLSSDPWLPESLAWPLLRELLDRGHTITFACDAVEDPSLIHALGPAITLRQRDRFCYRKQPHPGRLARWLQHTDSQLRRTHDAVLSLSWLCTADVWMPTGPSASTRALTAANRFASPAHLASITPGTPITRRLPRMLCDDAVYADTKAIPGVFRRAAVEYLARSRADRADRLATILVHSEAAAADARAFCRTVRPRTLPPTDLSSSPSHSNQPAAPLVINALPCAGSVFPAPASGHPGSTRRPPQAATAELRRTTRLALAIGPAETVALVPRLDRISRDTLALFAAAAQRGGRDGRAPVRLLIVCPDPYAVTQNAHALGCTLLSTVAPTHRFDALLAASDYAILPDRPPSRPFFTGSAHRAAADFLRSARPVICIAGTGAAELIGQTAERAAGIVLPAGVPPDWHRALQIASDPSWRISAAVTARATADVFGLSPASLAARVEAALAQAAHRLLSCLT